MTHIVASYTTKQNETELDLERKLTAGTYTTVTDGGAGGDIVVDLNTTTADARYVNVTGDTMTGTLLITPSNSTMQLKLHPTLALTDSGVTYNPGFFYNSAGEPIFTMIRSTAGTTMLGGGVNGDTWRRFTVDVGGALSWGDGANAVDVVFQRTAANLMRLYDGLIVDNQLSIGMTGTTAKLNITQAANTESGGIIITNSGAGRTFRIWVDGSNVCRLDSGSGGGGDIAINTTGAGKVGLGTITPAARLDVVGKADVIQLQVTANGTQTSDLARIGDGTNYTAFEKDGTLKMVGTATVWDDQQVNLSYIKAPASDPPTWRSYRGCELPAYGAANTNVLYFTHQITHRYKVASDINFHIHVAYPDANTGNSYWAFTYSWANIDGTFSAKTTVNGTFAAPGVADRHALHSFGTISGTGKAISSVLLCSLARIGGDAADTYASDIYAVSADFHVEFDTLGSRTDTAK